jgi:hypothetical protein
MEKLCDRPVVADMRSLLIIFHRRKAVLRDYLFFAKTESQVQMLPVRLSLNDDK